MDNIMAHGAGGSALVNFIPHKVEVFHSLGGSIS